MNCAAIVDQLPRSQRPNTSWHRTKISPCTIVSVCTSCKEYLPITSFYRLSNGSNKGRKSIVGENRLSVCAACSVKKYVEIDHRQKLLYSAKAHAREKGIACTLTVDDIRIPTHCPVLGIKLEPKVGQGRQGCRNFESSPSIDRIDNNKAYTPDNICVISARANHLKSNASIDEIESVLRYMKAGAAKYSAAACQTNDSNGGGGV